MINAPINSNNLLALGRRSLCVALAWLVGHTLTTPSASYAAPTSSVEQTDRRSLEQELAERYNTKNAPLPPGFIPSLDDRRKDKRPPPTLQERQTLNTLEAEFGKFNGQARAYAQTIDALVNREYAHRRRLINQRFAARIRDEEKNQGQARAQAIQLLERFVEEHPNDAERTPDSMFRLGELYFERSQLEFQRDQSAQRIAPDYSPTITLYQQLVQRFPEYVRIAGVYYLIGFCLNEMARVDEARMAWLNLVCANQFSYDPAQFDTNDDPNRVIKEDEKNLSAYPSLQLKVEDRRKKPQIGSYAGCKPIRPNAGFQSETWFRIGEYHFDDYGSDNAIELAISAYTRILGKPNDRNYNLALYKVAWAYYRESRYPEAIKHFAMLVDWSDEQKKKTGRIGSELRPEAVQYLGISFAYEDWNENQVPDSSEGEKHGIDRIQDPSLLPQDKPWTSEIYYQLAQIYFDEVKYEDVIRIAQVTINRWPMDMRVPALIDLIARAYVRRNNMEEATAWRTKLSEYNEESAWWKANKKHPEVQRRTKRLAEEGILRGALYHHQQAQRLRRYCVAEQDPELCTQAQTQYGVAATSYKSYLALYPNSPQGYELLYNYADALYWSEQYLEASKAYADVRDSNLDDRFQAEAARRVVESVKRVMEKEVQQGTVSMREEPPGGEGEGATPVSPLDMPERLQQLGQAREIYIARIENARDSEDVLESYDFNNALLLYLYGYWPHARARFERIFRERCKGQYGDDTGRIAWLNLRNMAIELGETNEVERIGKMLNSMQCTFASGDKPSSSVDCSDPKNKEEPECLAASDLTNVRYKKALDVFKQAEAASGDEQVKLYERASSMLVAAVNEEPNHKDAPIALEMAAIALERTSRFESAARLYERIITQVGPLQGKTPEEQDRLDRILANAHFRLAYNANRIFDFELALRHYRILSDSVRFKASKGKDIQEKREDALFNTAIALEWVQRYQEAAEYYRRVASVHRNPETRRTASFQAAEMDYKRGSWNTLMTSMQNFVRAYQNDKQSGELVVKAYWRVAQAQEKIRKLQAYRTSLAKVISTYNRLGQKSGSNAAKYAAQAAFILADEGSSQFEDFSIKANDPPTLDAYIKDIAAQIDTGLVSAKRFVEGYAAVPSYGRPTWTIAAFVRQGRIYEVLARAVLNTPFVVPADMEKQLRKLSVDQREEIRLQVEDRIRMLLDEKVRPIECRAVARYALGARAAKVGAMDNQYTQTAIDRLQAYGDERIAACIEQARQQDSSFAPYQSGEFTRAPRGKILPLPQGVVSPKPPSANGASSSRVNP